jgi:hypothetical protein
MFVYSVAPGRHFMQEGHFAPIAPEWLLIQMKSVKVPRGTSRVIELPKANFIWRLLIAIPF